MDDQALETLAIAKRPAPSTWLTMSAAYWTPARGIGMAADRKADHQSSARMTSVTHGRLPRGQGKTGYGSRAAFNNRYDNWAAAASMPPSSTAAWSRHCASVFYARGNGTAVSAHPPGSQQVIPPRSAGLHSQN